jgi:serine-type D-Ala-D-Ala carboxypeptidase/endopeptidase
MLKKIIPALLCISTLFIAAKKDQASNEPNITEIEKIIQQEVASNRSKSIIVGIIDARGRRFVSAGSYSDLQQLKPDANTVYEIGSIGKLFTSLVLADMALKRELQLTDPISKFLPDTVQTPTYNGKKIALLNLSTHRAGFPRMAYNVDQKNVDRPFADYNEMLLYEYLTTFRLSREIDSKWEYSNIGYGLLGHLLTRHTHKNYETLVQEHICKPLGMTRTTLDLAHTLKTNKAVGHNESGHAMAQTVSVPVMEGAGFLLSSADDLLTFAGAQLGLIESPLSEAMKLTHLPQGPKDGNDGYITMGWTLLRYDGQELLWKDGGTPGFRSFIGIDKKNKYAVVILSNSDNQVTDIGLHVLDTAYPFKPYRYKWDLMDTLNTCIQARGVDAGIALYKELKAASKPNFVFDPTQLLQVGNALQRAGRLADAIRIYELNVSEYPNVPPVLESLAEAQKRAGNSAGALANFEKLAAMDSQNFHWEWMIGRLRK